MSGPLYDGNLYYEPEDINKEVETLARIMCPLLEVNFNSAPRKEWEYSSCYECLTKSGCDGCEVIDNAQRAIKAGYRKASEVAEEIFAEIDKRFADILSCIHGGTLKAILNSDKEAEEIHRNMLTMAQAIRECVAELKKKYTEEGK